MEQYIPKSALVAEIESSKSAAETMLTGKTDLSYWKAQKYLCERFLSFIGTLEVKEVDSDDAFGACWGEYCDCGGNINDYKIAKHFFELGMQVSNKVQKGE